MNFRQKVILLTILAAIQFPCVSQAAEEDRDLALIAAEQERSDEDEKLGEINPALTENISSEPTQETDREKKERKKKLKQTRKEKERENERRLQESANRRETRRQEEVVIIDPNESEPQPEPVTPPAQTPRPQPAQTPQPTPAQTPQPQPAQTPRPQPAQTPQPTPAQTPQSQPAQTPQPTPAQTPQSQPAQTPQSQPAQTPQPQPAQITQPVQTAALPNERTLYANFAEVARAAHFIPLYMPKKSGYEITAIYAAQGVVEIRYGRRWEPTVSLTVRTYKRPDGEELRDISGVSGVKWRVDTTTGTTLYIAKISDTEQVAAWAVGHYTFSARAENLSFAGFHSLVADELVELSTHYYLDL